MGENEGLPAHLRESPPNRLEWERPTAWLLGTKIAASLRDIALASIYESDPRDWMSAGPPIRLEDAITRGTNGEPDGAWIDFLADTGDSPRLVYRLAYLLQRRELHANGRTLPRGRALVIGGDTAYPVAEPVRLIERILAPVQWARDRLRAEDERLTDKQLSTDVVPILGIPGNHDYYNILNGYVRHFRAPPEPLQPPLEPRPSEPPGTRPPPPDLKGYVARQQASYFAALLPYGWQLWGLDVEMRGLDDRQRHYFHQVRNAHPCDARIVINSKPPVVYNARNTHAAKLEAMYHDLGLKAPFAAHGNDTLPPDQVQLDLSGDVHTYERYWGQDVAGDPLAGEAGVTDGALRGNETEPQTVSPPIANYASVVSGLGGAFHHPAQVRFGTMAPRRSWPDATESARTVGRILMRPRKVMQAGAVGLIGALLALLGFGLAKFQEYEDRDTVGALVTWAATPKHLPETVGDVIGVATAELRARLHDRGRERDRADQFVQRPRSRKADRSGRNPLCMPWRSERTPPLAHLGIVGSIVGTLVLLGVAFWQLSRWLRRLARPLDAPARSTRWSRLTRRLADARVVGWLLRWAGVNRRSAWRAMATFPAWGAMIGAAIGVGIAFGTCPRLADAADGYAPLHTAIIVLLVGMALLGVLLGGERHAPRGPLAGAWKRTAIGVFGFLIGALIIWTPFAWTLLVCRNLGSLSWVAAFVGFWLFRKLFRGAWARVGFDAFDQPAIIRRTWLIVVFLALAAFYVAVPLRFIDFHDGRQPDMSWWGLIPAIFFGGYFTCQWVGWYFLLCLQWNAHGNEAGTAARVARYAEFLRIKLTQDTAEVWTLAPSEERVESPPWWQLRAWWRFWWPRGRQPEPPIHAVVVDHFIVKRTPPA